MSLVKATNEDYEKKRDRKEKNKRDTRDDQGYEGRRASAEPDAWGRSSTESALC